MKKDNVPKYFKTKLMVLLVTKVPKTSLLRFLLASIKISFSFFMKVQKKSYFLNRHD